jgi:hypothetical protein
MEEGLVPPVDVLGSVRSHMTTWILFTEATLRVLLKILISLCHAVMC